MVHRSPYPRTGLGRFVQILGMSALMVVLGAVACLAALMLGCALLYLGISVFLSR